MPSTVPATKLCKSGQRSKWISDSFPQDRKHISHALADESGVHLVELI